MLEQNKSSRNIGKEFTLNWKIFSCTYIDAEDYAYFFWGGGGLAGETQHCM
jgi:hypothetical protein